MSQCTLACDYCIQLISVSISRQQLQHIFMFSLRSRAGTPIENANSFQENKGCVRNFREDTGRQGQPEEQDLVLICPSFERKLQEWPVARNDRHMEVRVLQVDRCKPISGTDVPEDAFLREYLEWKLVKGPVQDVQIQDWP